MNQMISYLVGLCIFVSVVTSAPLDQSAASKEQVVKRSAETTVQEVNHQDEDLQELLQLINNQASQENVMVHKEKVTHFENNNGNTLKINEEEEKVMDSNTGAVIADIKQEVKQQTPEGQEEPETVVETKVEIPSEGVHETFVQNGAQDPSPTGIDALPSNDDTLPSNEDSLPSNKEVTEEESEVSPTDMAEYLYYTQQFDAFFAGLDRLVNQSKLSSQDASSYARAVAAEYERIQVEEQSFFDEAQTYPSLSSQTGYQQPLFQRQQRSSYQQALTPEEEMYLMQSPPDSYAAAPSNFAAAPINYAAAPSSYAVAPSTYDAAPSTYAAAPSSYDAAPSSYDATSQTQSSDIDPYEFLAALWTEAYGNGNAEAQEIVQILYDRVSHDDNPDDMAQIRDILMETAASSLSDIPLGTVSQAQQPSDKIPNAPEQLLNLDAAKSESVESKEYKKANLEATAVAEELKEAKEAKEVNPLETSNTKSEDVAAEEVPVVATPSSTQ